MMIVRQRVAVIQLDIEDTKGIEYYRIGRQSLPLEICTMFRMGS